MPHQDTHFTILNAARLVDGTGAPVAEAAAILLEGDTIRQIGTRETVRAPDGATFQELDYGDATILPGLVDCHVHLIGIGDGRAGDEMVTLPDEVLTVQGGPERAPAPLFGCYQRAGMAEPRTAPRSCSARRLKWASSRPPVWCSLEGPLP